MRDEAIGRAWDDRWLCLSRVIAGRAYSGIETNGPLAGVPYVAKNAFDVAGIHTLAGGPDVDLSALRTPLFDAALIRRLDAAGARLVGLAHMDEYAYGFLGDNPHHGVPLNPVDADAYPGGSSSGSAVAVAAGIVPFAIGTDTNGSVRVPAAFCGVFSLKPTYGTLPLDGCIPLAPTLDHAGLIAASLDMLERVWRALEGNTSADHAALRPGFASDAFLRFTDAPVRLAFDAARSIYDDAPRMDLPDVEASLAAASLITAYEAGAIHAERRRTSAHRYSAAIHARLDVAEQISRDHYALALCALQRIRTDTLAKFASHDVDVLIAPVAPVHRIAIGQREVTLDGIAMSAADAAGLFTRPFSLTGFPVLTIPANGAIHVPLQLIAPPHHETRLLKFARMLLAGEF